tara:strand:- start:2123 stop:2758 length:636 start_codon:yes stop_codon:yes gene_type:complete
MAILQAGRKAGGDGSAPWLGIQKANIVEFRDESSKWDWAEIYLVAELKVSGSDYNRPLKIAGSFERNPDGTVQENSLVRRINYLCVAMGWNGGINQHGKFEDEDGKEIDDIASYLNDMFADNSASIPGAGSDNYPYLVYVYKELPKNGKSYTRVHNKIMKNEGTNERKLADHIAYLKKNNYLKEAPETSSGSDTLVVDNIDDLKGMTLENL